MIKSLLHSESWLTGLQLNNQFCSHCCKGINQRKKNYVSWKDIPSHSPTHSNRRLERPLSFFFFFKKVPLYFKNVSMDMLFIKMLNWKQVRQFRHTLVQQCRDILRVTNSWPVLYQWIKHIRIHIAVSTKLYTHSYQVSTVFCYFKIKLKL